MDNKESKKQAYTKPEIKVIPILSGNFLLTASVTPNGSASNTTTWDAEQEYNGNTFFIGNGSSVAPAKDWGNVWEEEE